MIKINPLLRRHGLQPSFPPDELRCTFYRRGDVDPVCPPSPTSPPRAAEQPGGDDTGRHDIAGAQARQTAQPTTPVPGSNLDQEIDRTNAAVSDIIDFVRQVIDDDGTIKQAAQRPRRPAGSEGRQGRQGGYPCCRWRYPVRASRSPRRAWPKFGLGRRRIRSRACPTSP